jgi:hypothetical protein
MQRNRAQMRKPTLIGGKSKQMTRIIDAMHAHAARPPVK